MTTKSTRHERAANENTFKTQIVENFNETECKTCYRRLRRVIDAFFESFKWLCLEREREKTMCASVSVFRFGSETRIDTECTSHTQNSVSYRFRNEIPISVSCYYFLCWQIERKPISMLERQKKMKLIKIEFHYHVQ